jgi:hypothetical protein
MNKLKKESLKSINLKNAKYCHIFKNEIIIYFKKENSQGIITEWEERCPNEIPIRLQSGKNFNARSIYFNDKLVGLLKDIESIEFWPENQSRESHYKLSTIILKCKKFELDFNSYLIDGKNYKHFDIDIITSDKNELF